MHCHRCHHHYKLAFAQDSNVSAEHCGGDQLWTGNVGVPAIDENLRVIFFLIKSLTCASVCGYRFAPNVSCAGSGFICSRRYWKRIPRAIWIQLIQLNTVNNWSDSETEPCHMGAVTSPLAGRNPTPVQLDCPGLFVPQSAHCIWLPPVKDTKQEHERRMGGYSGIVVLSQSAQWQQSHWSPRPWKLMRLSHARRGLQICTQSDLISRFGKKKGKVGSCLPLQPFLTVRVWPLLIGCAASRATKGLSLRKTSMWTRWTPRGSIIFLAMK